MKKAMLLLCLSLFLPSDVQANVPGGQLENRNHVEGDMQTAILLEAVPDAYPQKAHLPAIQYTRLEIKLADMSSAEMKRELVKADLDEEAGQVDWKTAIIVLCVAFLVYWINKSKRQDID